MQPHVVKNRNEAIEAFTLAVEQAKLGDDPMGGLFLCPYTGTTGNGMVDMVGIPLGGGMLVEFPPEAVRFLDAVAIWLLAQPVISRVFAKGDVLPKLWRAAAEAAVDSTISPKQKFLELRDRLRAERLPSLTLVPIGGVVVGDKLIDLGPVVIGRVGKVLEDFLSARCREYGQGGFRFNDEVVWTEDFTAWRSDPGIREEIDLSETPVIAAVWTREQGSKALGRVHEKLAMLLATIGYLAALQGQEGFSEPHIMGVNEYVKRFQEHDEDAGYDEFQFLQASAESQPEGVSYHRFSGNFIDLDALFNKERYHEVATQLLTTLENQGPAWADRFARHVQWCHIGVTASEAATAVIAYSVALEALVSPRHASESITRIIAERVALLEPQGDVEERLVICREVAKLYNERCRLAHGQKLVLAWSEEASELVARLNQRVRRVGEHFLEFAQANKWETEKDMESWFDHRRFFVPQ